MVDAALQEELDRLKKVSIKLNGDPRIDANPDNLKRIAEIEAEIKSYDVKPELKPDISKKAAQVEAIAKAKSRVDGEKKDPVATEIKTLKARLKSRTIYPSGTVDGMKKRLAELLKVVSILAFMLILGCNENPELAKVSPEWLDKFGNGKYSQVCYNIAGLDYMRKKQHNKMLEFDERLRKLEDPNNPSPQGK